MKLLKVATYLCIASKYIGSGGYHMTNLPLRHITDSNTFSYSYGSGFVPRGEIGGIKGILSGAMGHSPCAKKGHHSHARLREVMSLF